MKKRKRDGKSFTFSLLLPLALPPPPHSSSTRPFLTHSDCIDPGEVEIPSEVDVTHHCP